MGADQIALATPLGTVTLVATDEGLAEVRLAPVSQASRGTPLLEDAARQLTEWFSGHRTTFDLPLAAAGTPFQQAVWDVLRAIPFGETRTYAQVAAEAGRPRAMRAVGAAIGRNPLPVVVPCHRVVGADGGLTGYVWGLRAKRWLLAHEARDDWGPLARLVGA